MGRSDWIKSDTEGFDLWIVAWWMLHPIAPFHFFQKLFNFRRELIAVFDSRREYRPVHPLHEIFSIHQGRWDEVEPGGGSMSVF